MSDVPTLPRRHRLLLGGATGIACAAAVYAAAANAAAAYAEAASTKAPPIRVTYLANEGVMLEGTGGRVLIDALFGDGLPEYAVVPAASRDSLERALGHYGGPALVLTTHPHRDHFDSLAVARYVASNRRAVAFPPPDTLPHTGGGGDLEWVSARPVAIPHGPTRRPVGHTAWLVTLDGVTALHIGDAGSEPRTWPALGLGDHGLDIALVPYWYATNEDTFQELLDVLRPRTVVLLHVPLDADRRGEWQRTRQTLRDRYPQVRTPAAAGEVVSLETARR